MSQKKSTHILMNSNQCVVPFRQLAALKSLREAIEEMCGTIQANTLVDVCRLDYSKSTGSVVNISQQGTF